LGEHNVGLAEMEMTTLPNERGEIMFLTHKARESDFRAACAQLEKTNVVTKIANTIRIIE
jgi:hypothetical protein